MFECETAKLHRFCPFSHRLRTKRDFLEESLDIISLMWYNIIHKSVKLLDEALRLSPEPSYKISHKAAQMSVAETTEFAPHTKK